MMDLIISIGFGWAVYCTLMMVWVLTEIIDGQREDAE
jgi:hypothetical protein